jgi:glutamate 5-kinase
VEVGSSVEEHITSALSETGVGGMNAKVSAAKLAGHGGVPAIIADGLEPGLLPKIVKGEDIGTLFMPRESKLTSRKRWIALRSRSHGIIRVDDGAKKAILQNGASLLPTGIRAVQGQFQMGARVELQDEKGSPFAVGLASYSAADMRRLQGRKRSEFKEILGYEYVREIVNRDDMVVLE